MDFFCGPKSHQTMNQDDTFIHTNKREGKGASGLPENAGKQGRRAVCHRACPSAPAGDRSRPCSGQSASPADRERKSGFPGHFLHKQPVSGHQHRIFMHKTSPVRSPLSRRRTRACQSLGVFPDFFHPQTGFRLSFCSHARHPPHVCPPLLPAAAGKRGTRGLPLPTQKNGQKKRLGFTFFQNNLLSLRGANVAFARRSAASA